MNTISNIVIERLSRNEKATLFSSIMNDIRNLSDDNLQYIRKELDNILSQNIATPIDVINQHLMQIGLSFDAENLIDLMSKHALLDVFAYLYTHNELMLNYSDIVSNKSIDKLNLFDIIQDKLVIPAEADIDNLSNKDLLTLYRYKTANANGTASGEGERLIQLLTNNICSGSGDVNIMFNGKNINLECKAGQGGKVLGQETFSPAECVAGFIDHINGIYPLPNKYLSVDTFTKNITQLNSGLYGGPKCLIHTYKNLYTILEKDHVIDIKKYNTIFLSACCFGLYSAYSKSTAIKNKEFCLRKLSAETGEVIKYLLANINTNKAFNDNDIKLCYRVMGMAATQIYMDMHCDKLIVFAEKANGNYCCVDKYAALDELIKSDLEITGGPSVSAGAGRANMFKIGLK